MMQEPFLLLIAQPGHLRDSLQVLLAALSGSSPMVVASDWPMGTTGVVGGHPNLILLVLEPGNPDEEASAMVSQIKTRWPQSRLVALVDTEQQRQVITSAGADHAWFKGTLAAQMLVEIEAFLKR